MSANTGAAVALTAAYLLFCGFIYWRHVRACRAQQAGDGVLVAFASQAGFAEALARESAAVLEAAGITTHLMPLGEVTGARLAAARRALFVISTTGEGDAPDNAARFARQVMSAPLALPHLEYALLSLGDSAYRRYCGFGRDAGAWLAAQGAREWVPPVEVDNGNDAQLGVWRAQLEETCGAASGAWHMPSFESWRLAERELLNPGSLGDPACRIALTPMQDMPHWEAGDIAVIEVPLAKPDETGEVRTLQRDYSIASLPEDGRLELLVRQVRKEDGSLGTGSGWLTARAADGAEVRLLIRSNAAFHAPDDDRPAIFIGNGSGLAGLRAHIKARAARGRHRNWLIFGERQAACDFFFREEIETWREKGVLARTDFAFSRDQAEKRYVQHCLLDAAGEVRQWAAGGAVFYICGSRVGMAEEVDAALAAILGTDILERLKEDGRYRRDVY